jgi:hypothetical protein
VPIGVEDDVVGCTFGDGVGGTLDSCLRMCRILSTCFWSGDRLRNSGKSEDVGLILLLRTKVLGRDEVGGIISGVKGV